MKIFIASLVLAVLSTSALAWGWGAKDYDDCMAKEMKGRGQEQLSLVRNVCAKQFPALPNFMKPAKVGTLACETQGLSLEFIVSKKTVVNDVFGEFPIQKRTSDGVVASNAKWSLSMSFLTGELFLTETGSNVATVISCGEKRGAD